ncbi:unnamed protein product, partial [Ceratitis capitata]
IVENCFLALEYTIMAKSCQAKPCNNQISKQICKQLLFSDSDTTIPTTPPPKPQLIEFSHINTFQRRAI